jgi:hypothetical protein
LHIQFYFAIKIRDCGVTVPTISGYLLGYLMMKCPIISSLSTLHTPEFILLNIYEINNAGAFAACDETFAAICKVTIIIYIYHNLVLD